MSTVLCQLCSSYPTIRKSHVIPGFVFRAIKADSPTRFFRNPNNPNLRLQDGDKFPLLCIECEKRFGDAEGKFATNVFSAFHVTDQDQFSYGPWLHYFMTSLAWRTLILELPGLECDAAKPQAAMTDLREAAETMRLYLLGASNLATRLRNHAVVFTKAHSGPADLAATRPNVKIRRSAFGFTALHQRNGYSGILHNLAGFMCFLIVKGNPQDRWSGTKVNPSGGEIKQPQRVSSWLMHELLEPLVESALNPVPMSELQREKVREAMRDNPSARGLRFRELDNGFAVSE